MGRGSSSLSLAPSVTHIPARADVRAGEQRLLCGWAAAEGGFCARQGCSLEGCSCFNPLLTRAQQPPATLGWAGTAAGFAIPTRHSQPSDGNLWTGAALGASVQHSEQNNNQNALEHLEMLKCSFKKPTVEAASFLERTRALLPSCIPPCHAPHCSNDHKRSISRTCPAPSSQQAAKPSQEAKFPDAILPGCDAQSLHPLGH